MLSCLNKNVTRFTKSTKTKFFLVHVFWALGIDLHTLAQIETGKREEQQRHGVGQKLVAAGLE